MPDTHNTHVIAKATRLLTAIALAATVALGIGRPPAAYAAGLTVTTTADEFNTNGNCSLREAIRAARLGQTVDGCVPAAGANTVNMPAGSYVLAGGPNEDNGVSGDLDVISGTLTLAGAGVGQTTISGGGLDRVFDIHAGATMTVTKVTIQNGSSDKGGGIRNRGTLYLTSSEVSHNTSFLYGGGLWNERALYVSQSTFTYNKSGADGGIGIASGATATVERSAILGNKASIAGGIGTEGNLMVTSSSIVGNSGEYGSGGIHVYPSGRLQLTYSTVYLNNVVNASGGGVANYGTATVNNTIIATNIGMSGGSDCAGTLTSQGYNLLQFPSCTLAAQAGTDLLNLDPQLDAQSYNGGSTWNFMPLPGSPAIDAGGPIVGRVQVVDQRGIARPRDGNGDGVARSDIGAVER